MTEHKIVRSNDGGVDCTNHMHNGFVYWQDHKHLVITTGLISDLLGRQTNKYFCISTTKGISPDLLDDKLFLSKANNDYIQSMVGYECTEICITNVLGIGNIIYLYFTKK